MLLHELHIELLAHLPFVKGPSVHLRRGFSARPLFRRAMFFSAHLLTKASLEDSTEVEIPSEDFINLAAPLGDFMAVEAPSEDSTVEEGMVGGSTVEEATAEQESRGDEIVLTKMAHLRILPDIRTISLPPQGRRFREAALFLQPI